MHDEFKKLTNLRLYHLERSQNMFVQYNRRESFEIVGIPSTGSTDDLEEEVIDICNAKVFAKRHSLKKSDIQSTPAISNIVLSRTFCPVPSAFTV